MNRKVIDFIVEVALLVTTLLMGWKVIVGNPEEASYADSVIMPLAIVYVALYALKIFLLKVQSKLKYLFYLAFGALMLGLRFYEKVELTSSIKYIAIGCVAALAIYHVLSFFKKA